MKITILDTETGAKTHVSIFNRRYLEEGNGSCDCNRELLCGLDTNEGTCLGCKRFLVIECDDGGSLVALNEGYPKELLEKHGVKD